MPKITIDGKEYEFQPGETVLQVAWRNGIEIPVFCYHPHLPVFAGCRMCLVEAEMRGRRGLIHACATEAQEGLQVYTQTPAVRKSREGVLEFLLLHHPLDCPVCDAGGECDLQNITFRFARPTSRFDFPKTERERRYAGPFLELYPNRCIHCIRCVSFYQEIAADEDWGAFQRGHDMLVGPARDANLESEFSGNMIEICPLGAITGRDYRFKGRPWEQRTFLAVSPHDSVQAGVRLTVRTGGRYGRGPVVAGGRRGEWHEILRAQPRVVPAAQGVWIDDRTHFGHDFVNHPDRLLEPAVGGVPTTWDRALQEAAFRLREIAEGEGGNRIAGLAGGVGTNEAAFLFAQLLREVLGSPHLDHRPYDEETRAEDPLWTVWGSSASTATLEELENADWILLFGTQLRESHPTVGLRVISARRSGAQVFHFGPFRDKYARRVASRFSPVLPTQAEVAAFALTALAAQKLRRGLPALYESDPLSLLKDAGLDPEAFQEAIQSWVEAEKPILVFPDDLPPEAQKALAFLATLRENAGALVLRARPNGQGFTDMGVHPGLRAGQRLAPREGLSTAEILKAAAEGKIRALVLFHFDPFEEVPDRELVEKALERVEFVVLLGLFRSPVTAHADVVLPLAAPYEEEGSYTNLAGLLQWSERALSPLGMSRPASWVLAEILRLLGEEVPTEPRALFRWIQQEVPLYAGVPLPDPQITKHPYPRYIWTLDLLREEYRYPRVAYVWEEKIADLRPPEVRRHTGRLLLPARHLFKTYLGMREPRFQSLIPYGVVEMAPQDGEALGIADGDHVRLQTDRGALEIRVRLSGEVLPGCIRYFVPFGAEEGLNRILGGRWVQEVEVLKEVTV